MKIINSGVFETLIEFAITLELSAAELLFSCSLRRICRGKMCGETEMANNKLMEPRFSRGTTQWLEELDEVDLEC